MHAKAHDTHAHRDTENTFRRDATLLLVLLFHDVNVAASLSFERFGRTRNRAPCKQPVLHDYSRGLVDVSRRSLVFSTLCFSLSLCTPTITLSHRRPEQKGKSMKEKYDASARKSAFMLVSWSTVLRFHFAQHIRLYACVYIYMCICEQRAGNRLRLISSETETTKFRVRRP